MVAGQPSSQRSQQQNSVAPTIEGSPALSDAGPDGEWTPGETVQVTLTFSEEVSVDTTDGTPSIGIQLGGTLDRNASYTSGSGTTKLVFSYTLADDDGRHSSMFVHDDSLTLNDGTLTARPRAADAGSRTHRRGQGFISSGCHTQQRRDRRADDQRTAQVGQMLTASTSTYQTATGWPMRSSPTSGSQTMGPKTRISRTRPFPTYTLEAADEGKTIKVRVSFTDDGGTRRHVRATLP